MKSKLAVLVCAVLAFAVTDAGRRKRSVQLKMKATPTVLLEDISEQLQLDCGPADFNDVYVSFLVVMTHEDVNGTLTNIARQTTETELLVEGNRTSAKGHNQMSPDDEPSYLSVTILQPTVADEGIYTCKFVYVDDLYEPKSLASAVNVTIRGMPPTPEVFFPTLPPEPEDPICECAVIWEALDNITASFAMDIESLRLDNNDLRARVEELENKTVPVPLPVTVPTTTSTTTTTEATTTSTTTAAPVKAACTASFSAGLSSRDGVPLQSGSPLLFDSVISNLGGGYDSGTGAFVAPCAGQYYFSLSMRSFQNMDDGYVEGVIMKGGTAEARTSVFSQFDSNNYQSASTSVVLSLQEGDSVKVVMQSTSTGNIIGEDYTVFSGFAL